MQRSKSQPEVTSALFILYSWNYDLFWSSLQSYKAAGFGRRIIVIDNSYDRRIVNDAAVCILHLHSHAGSPVSFNTLITLSVSGMAVGCLS